MKIFGIKINKLKYEDFLKDLKKDLKSKKQNIVFTPNPEILLNTKEDKKFRLTINKANYLTSDGIGLYIGFQIKTSPLTPFLLGEGNIKYFLRVIGNILLLPYYFFNLFFRKKYLYKKYGDRICGSDITLDLVKYAEKNKIKITILDPYYPKDLAKCKSQEKFRENLLKKFPKLNFDYFIYNSKDKEEIIKKIGGSNSKILFSTLGMKTQEESVIEITSECKNIKLGLGIGSSFDYFIGFQKRAPIIWRKVGLEWLYRLITGPQKTKRLKRLYKAIFIFLWEVLKEK